jgi:chorismate mutase
VKKKIFELRPWRSFLLGIGSARSAPIKNNNDIPTTDTNEIEQLINRVKWGELDQDDAQLIEKLLNILLMIASLLQRKYTSMIRLRI